MGIIDKFRLDGKSAIVTGVSSGLGVSFTEGLAEAGIVEFDRIPYGFVLASPYSAFNIADNLNIERGVGFGR